MSFASYITFRFFVVRIISFAVAKFLSQRLSLSIFFVIILPYVVVFILIEFKTVIVINCTDVYKSNGNKFTNAFTDFSRVVLTFTKPV